MSGVYRNLVLSTQPKVANVMDSLIVSNEKKLHPNSLRWAWKKPPIYGILSETCES
jgi:hypothetical protein